jgi:predicted methyltransferase
MKKVFMLGLVALALPLTGCGTGVDVVDYNDKLVDLQNACYDAENVMMDAWDQENY